MKLSTSDLLILVLCISGSTSAPSDVTTTESPVVRTTDSSESELDLFVEMCAKKMGVPLVDAWTSLVMPVIYPGNCIVACVWKEIGLVDLNGKILKDEMIESIRTTLSEMPDPDDSSKKEFLSEAKHVYECIEEANANDEDCDIVASYFKCMVRDFFDL
ncbi:hypothetical protein QAD02_016865 [Eretmocerus hayati]|uniref:Uncharacterized protein n=1 Tax=Eretmocerus hayati TaxID=131215 RepID=A0ACC2PDB1_9HYME|nr:hypothetical protein QAD02_016865 [Eretmocerus hayati]